MAAGLRVGVGGGLTGASLATRMKLRSSSDFMCRSRDFAVLPPKTTAMSRRPLRLTEAARLKPEARM